jgi:hypothetical protein
MNGRAANLPYFESTRNKDLKETKPNSRIGGLSKTPIRDLVSVVESFEAGPIGPNSTALQQFSGFSQKVTLFQ